MWNRKRCKVYSRIVQTMLPSRNDATVKDSPCGVTDCRYGAVNGKSGACTKGGSGRAKLTTDLTKRLTAMGSQINGTTNHFVRVKISRKSEPKRRAGSGRCRGW